MNTTLTKSLRVAGSLLVAGLAAGAAQAQEKFTYQTNWYAQAEHGGFYAALANGLYRKHGLDVTVKMGGPQLNSLQMMVAGQADCMMSTDFAALVARNTGVPVVTVAAVFQKDPQVLIAHDDVRSFEDMKSKTILIGAASNRTFWPWLKAKYGFTDSQVRPYTFNVQPFVGDRNTVMQGFLTSEPFSLQKAGVKTSVFMLSDYGYPAYNTTVLCMEDTIRKRASAVGAFVRAAMEGWKAYLADPAGGNALIKKENPNMTDEQLGYSVGKLKELGMITSGDAVRGGIGIMTEARLKTGYDLMVSAGVVDPAKVEFAKTYSLDFIRDVRVLP